MAEGVLVDAGVLIALLSRRDRHHSWAAAQFSSLALPGRLRSGPLRGLPPPRDSGSTWPRHASPPRRRRPRLRPRRRTGPSLESHAEVRRHPDESGRCLPRADDQNLGRPPHPHDRRRFPHLSTPQPSRCSLHDTILTLPPAPNGRRPLPRGPISTRRFQKRPWRQSTETVLSRAASFCAGSWRFADRIVGAWPGAGRPTREVVRALPPAAWDEPVTVADTAVRPPPAPSDRTPGGWTVSGPSPGKISPEQRGCPAPRSGTTRCTWERP